MTITKLRCSTLFPVVNSDVLCAIILAVIAGEDSAGTSGSTYLNPVSARYLVTPMISASMLYCTSTHVHKTWQSNTHSLHSVFMLSNWHHDDLPWILVSGFVLIELKVEVSRSWYDGGAMILVKSRWFVCYFAVVRCLFVSWHLMLLVTTCRKICSQTRFEQLHSQVDIDSTTRYPQLADFVVWGENCWFTFKVNSN